MRYSFDNNANMLEGGAMIQGNWGSNFGNWFPGGAPISRVHDAWLSPSYGNISKNLFTNWGTMPIAAVLTYTALAIDHSNAYMIYKNTKRAY